MGADRGRCPLFVMNLHLKNDHFLIQLNYYMTIQGGLQARLPGGLRSLLPPTQGSNMEITLLPKDAGLCLIHRRDARSRRKHKRLLCARKKAFVSMFLIFEPVP